MAAVNQGNAQLMLNGSPFGSPQAVSPFGGVTMLIPKSTPLQPSDTISVHYIGVPGNFLPGDTPTVTEVVNPPDKPVTGTISVTPNPAVQGQDDITVQATFTTP